MHQAILKRKVDPNVQREDGCTPLDLANKSGSDATYRVLEAWGGKLNNTTLKDRRPASTDSP